MLTQQESFHEETITFGGPAATLAGTLTIPNNACPRGSILILSGSGRQDRDGNSDQMQFNVYRDLAHVLSGQGFVTLRYDKRGVGASQVSDKSSAMGFWDLVDDAAAAAEYLRQRTAADPRPVILLGHSEGCIIAGAVNAKCPVDGIIWLAGPCESMHESLLRQQALGAEDLAKLRGIAGTLVRLLRIPEGQRRKSAAVMEKVMASEDPWIRVSGARMNAKWMREHFRYDVSRDLPKVSCPILTFGGTKDVQVPPEHARMVAESAAGPAEWHVIPDMTHMLRRTTEALSMLTLIKLYKQQCKEPIDAELLGTTRAWLDAHFPS